MKDSGVDCATCAHPNEVCPVLKKRQCYCALGYVRDENGRCVLPISCSQRAVTDCGVNLEEVQCLSNDCPPTCLNPLATPCPPAGCTPGCECEAGYIFVDPVQAICIPTLQCPSQCKYLQKET